MRVIGRVYRVISEAYPSTARSRINLVKSNLVKLVWLQEDIVKGFNCFVRPFN